MARDFYINGATLVKVKGTGALRQFGKAAFWELGLSIDPIRIIPRFIHQDVHCDDFGPDIPAEVLNMLADVTIVMKLVHFDSQILGYCVTNSLGSTDPRNIVNGVQQTADGTLPGAGTPMGGGVALGQTGNNYISLNLFSATINTQNTEQWRFPASFLAERPFEWPLGTEKSEVTLTWRAIPYVPPTGEVISSGVVLFDHTADTN